MDSVAVLEKPVVEGDWRQRVIEIILAAPDPLAKRKITYEEFLAWADEDTLAEWVNGEIQMRFPASDRHQELVGFLSTTLGIYVEMYDLGQVILSPFQMKLSRSGRAPDLIFLTSAHQARLTEFYLDGPADLVVEIASSESVGRDRGEKFYEYARGGVPEYWLIDPDAQWAEFYRLGEFGLYESVLTGREGQYRSAAVADFWLRVEWLWRPPRVLDALRELQIVG
jgi:Uma2 family endonuclease